MPRHPIRGELRGGVALGDLGRHVALPAGGHFDGTAVEPTEQHGAALIRGVRVGAVQQAGVADHQLPGAHRHVHRARMVVEHPLVGFLHLVTAAFVGRDQVAVQVRALAVAAGNDAQAAVGDVGFGEIPVQEHHLRPRREAHGVVPAHPVLVPVERRAAGRLGDDLKVADGAELAKAQRIEQSGGLLDEEVHGAVGWEVVKAPGAVGANAGNLDVRALILPLLRVLCARKPVVRPMPEALNVGMRHRVVDEAVAIVDQALPCDGQRALVHEIQPLV